MFKFYCIPLILQMYLSQKSKYLLQDSSKLEYFSFIILFKNY